MLDKYSFTDRQIELIWGLDFSWDDWLKDAFNPSDLDERLDIIYNEVLSWGVFTNDPSYLDRYLPSV